MRFISIGPTTWSEPLHQAGHQVVTLSSDAAAGAAIGFDLEAGLARGRHLSRILPTALADARPADVVLLDLEPSVPAIVQSAQDAALARPIHEALGILQVVRVSDTLLQAVDAANFRAFWSCLLSRTCFKVVEESGLARELAAFGIPNVIHVPEAVAAPAQGTEPAGPAEVIVIGAERSGALDSQRAVNTADLWAGVLAQAVEGDLPGVTFFDLYFHLYRLAPPPTRADSLEAVYQKAQGYFQAKRRATAIRQMASAQRFVRLLTQRLGARVRLQPGESSASGPASQPGEPGGGPSPIYVGLGDATHSSARIPSLLDVASGGGFLLAHRSTGIETFLEPGSECEVFRDEHQLLSRIEHHLAHPADREPIRQAARRRVLTQHLPQHRVPILLEHLAAFHQRVEPATARVVRDIPPATATDTRVSAAAVEAAPAHPNIPPQHRIGGIRTLLILQNPGRVSRFYLQGLSNAAQQLGLRTCVLELGPIWSNPQIPRERIAAELTALVERERIDAVLGYTFNGVFDLPRIRQSYGPHKGLFSHLGLPHLMLWTDHPHWAHERAALQRDAQAALREFNHVHFVKSASAANEVSHFLGWPNVHGLAVGEDPALVCPARNVKPDFDAVLIVGSPPYLPEELHRFVDQDTPDEDQILGVVAGRTLRMLEAVWTRVAPPSLRDKLSAFGIDWVEAKRRSPAAAAFRHYLALRGTHPDAAHWLEDHYEAYFEALTALWEFGRWQRTFAALHLSRFLRIGVFGKDWSGIGLAGSGEWVDYARQASIYARGRVALNINQCNDEEGVSHKAFQITASAVACLHLHRAGLQDLYDVGVEMESFSTISEAREKLGALLADGGRREAMAEAGLARFRRDHTWARRLERMLAAIEPRAVSDAGVLTEAGAAAATPSKLPVETPAASCQPAVP